MPGLGGVRLAEWIRLLPDKQKSSVPILAITANLLIEDRDNYKQAGINGFVNKPFKEIELFKALVSFV